MPQEGERNVRPRFPHTNELRIARCAMGASERSVVQCLDDIRLALCVRSEEDLHARIERKRKLLIVTVGTQYK